MWSLYQFLKQFRPRCRQGSTCHHGCSKRADVCPIDVCCPQGRPNPTGKWGGQGALRRRPAGQTPGVTVEKPQDAVRTHLNSILHSRFNTVEMDDLVARAEKCKEDGRVPQDS
eukprot:2528954-Amphidinium_carterae.2